MGTASLWAVSNNLSSRDFSTYKDGKLKPTVIKLRVTAKVEGRQEKILFSAWTDQALICPLVDILSDHPNTHVSRQANM